MINHVSIFVPNTSTFADPRRRDWPACSHQAPDWAVCGYVTGSPIGLFEFTRLLCDWSVCGYVRGSRMGPFQSPRSLVGPYCGQQSL